MMKLFLLDAVRIFRKGSGAAVKPTIMRIFLLLLSVFLIVVPDGATEARPPYAPCPGYNSLLSVGKQARVVPGTSVRIRQNPTTSAAELNNVPENSIVMVLAGNECGDNFTWWKVRYRSTIGWMAEGQGDTHWLDRNLTTAVPPGTPVSGVSGTAPQTAQFNGDLTCLSFAQGTSIVYGGSTPVSGSRVDYSLDNILPPLICTANTSDALAIAPDGTAVTPEITARLQDGSVYSIGLPKWAYIIPGVWTLRGGGVALEINVQPTANPFMRIRAVQPPVADNGAVPTVPPIMIAPLPETNLQQTAPEGQIASAELSDYFIAVMPSDE
ncbi:MAG TPA: SH3 domain-containing protein, partial [Aggregatilineales bacterium]|nr:SH3 domain-containing protein [Aggregatilineales bacterium]